MDMMYSFLNKKLKKKYIDMISIFNKTSRYIKNGTKQGL